MTRRTLLAFGLATLAGAPALRAQDTVTVGIAGQLAGFVGDNLRVPVFADMTKANGKALGSYTLRITWNPAVLSYTGVHDGAFSSPLVQTDSTGNGVLYTSAISAQGLTGQFGLFDLQLSPVDTAADSVRVQVRELSAAGTLTDLLGSATVLTRGAPYCKALGRWGDVDGDSHANSRDALAILSNLVGLTIPSGFDLALGDADGDGVTNSRDALIILSYAVGLAVPGQRVMLVAAGPCGVTTPQFAVLPDTVDLVPGQAVGVKVFGQDGSGQPTALADLQWAMADPTVAAVDSSGRVAGRAPGATTLTAAIGPGAQITVPVIVRPRRSTWYVDAQRATLAPVQLGTQKWPFATPEFAFGLEAEGDTIRIAPGNVDYEVGGLGCGIYCDYYGSPGAPGRATQIALGGVLQHGVVVIGDTLADGTRPVLRAASVAQTAFEWDGGQRGELRNLVLQGFQTGVVLYGLHTLVVDNVDYRNPAGYGVGVAADGFVDTLRVSNSHFMADSVNQGYDGVYVYSGAAYVEVHGTTMQYMGAGLELTDVDSLDVAQSQFTYGVYGGILVYYGTKTLGARISHTRVLDDASSYYDAAIYIEGARNVGLDHNYIHESSQNAIQICAPGASCYGGGGEAPPLGRAPASGAPGLASPIAAGTRVTMLGDSIKFRGDSWNWLDVEQLDSLIADSLWLEDPADTAMYEYGYIATNYARITNSQLLNLYHEGFEFHGRQLVVDKTQFTGCAVAPCGWSGAGAVIAYPGNDSGPRITVSNSGFSNLASGVRANSSGSAPGPMVAASNVFDSVAAPLYLLGDSLAITDNVMTKVRDYGLYGGPGYTTGHPFVQAQILRNQVTCAVAGYTSYGLEHYDGPALFQDNAVHNCQYGLYVNNSSYPTAAVAFRGDTIFPDSVTSGRIGIDVEGAWQPSIVHSRIVGGYTGVLLNLSDAAVTSTIDTTAVSGTGYAAVDLSRVPGAANGAGNNIGNNLQYGVYDVSGVSGHGLTQGQFTGNASYAVYYFGNFSFDATNNYWGSSNGPGGGVADSVTANVTAIPYASTAPFGLPPLAPPLIASGAARRLGNVSPAAPAPAAAPSPELPRVLRPDEIARRTAQLAERRAARAAARAAHLQVMRQRVPRHTTPAAPKRPF
jgi:hypothetical protein